MNDKAVIIIPAYNPDDKLVQLVERLREAFRHIVVVDDGSTKGGETFPRVKALGAMLLRHDHNRGKGAALKTAFMWVSQNLPDAACVVTADSDGQHKVGDISKVADAAIANPERLILGTRAFSGKVPFRSRFGNWCTRQFFFLMTGLKIHDTQTGLRGIPMPLLAGAIAIPGERYEYEMRMLAAAKRLDELPVEVPIETIYIEENASSHFNPLKDSLRVWGALIHFCASSVMSFLLDNAIFTALVYCLARSTGWKRATYTLLAMFVARAVSATANYAYNRSRVFHSGASKSVSFAKYVVLAIAIFLTGYLFTAAFSRVFDAKGFAITTVKIAVETALFFLSYNIQKRWIFK